MALTLTKLSPSRWLLLLTTLLLCLLILHPSSINLRFNTSPSMPYGLYTITHKSLNHISRGDIVAVCMPQKLAALGKARGYLGAGDCSHNTEPVIKKVAALGGDKVTVDAGFVAVNGEILPHSARLLRDEQGRSIPHIAPENVTLKPKTLWLYGDLSPQSWDSRYYGAVSLNSVQHILNPLLTWS